MTLPINTKRRLAALESQNPMDDEPIEILIQIVNRGPDGPIKVGAPFSYDEIPKRIRKNESNQNKS